MRSEKSYSVEEAILKLEYYCSYQERCHFEVIQKLKSLKMIPLAIDTIITHLIENNFLNEERFSKNFTQGKLSVKKWGKIKIINELKLRNISKKNIELAIKEISDEYYYETFESLATKKWESITETNLLKKKKKFVDTLLRKGWESNLVYEKLREIEKN